MINVHTLNLEPNIGCATQRWFLKLRKGTLGTFNAWRQREQTVHMLTNMFADYSATSVQHRKAAIVLFNIAFGPTPASNMNSLRPPAVTEIARGWLNYTVAHRNRRVDSSVAQRVFACVENLVQC
jgi:hypothetical protein